MYAYRIRIRYAPPAAPLSLHPYLVRRGLVGVRQTHGLCQLCQSTSPRNYPHYSVQRSCTSFFCRAFFLVIRHMLNINGRLPLRTYSNMKTGFYQSRTFSQSIVASVYKGAHHMTNSWVRLEDQRSVWGQSDFQPIATESDKDHRGWCSRAMGQTFSSIWGPHEVAHESGQDARPGEAGAH
jgi:hypothetical protein